ncbi:MAG: flippase [Candidatus Dormibacteria bacterium]
MVRNFAALLAAEVVFRLGTVVLVIYISRRLGPQGLGALTYAQGLVAYLALVADLGLTALAIRGIAQRPGKASELAVAATVAQFATAVTLQFVLALVAYRLPVSGETRSLTLAFGLVMVAQSLSLIYVLQATERMASVALLRTLVNTGGLAVGAVALVVTGSLLAVPFATLLTTLIANLICVYLLRGAGLLRLHLPRARFVVSLAWKGAPLLVTGLTVQLLLNFDAIALGTMRGETELGYYAAPYRIVILGLSLGGIAMSAAFPRLAARSFAGASINLNLARLARLFGAVSLPGGVALAVLASDVLAVMYGHPYVRSTVVLQILAVVPAIGLLNMLIGQALVILNAQLRQMVVAVIASGVNVGLNLLLIPRYGGTGAALANAMSELMTLALFLILARHYVATRSTLGAFVSNAPVALGLLAVLLVGRNLLGLGIVLELATGMVAFLALNAIFNRRLALELFRDLRPA